MLLLSLVEDKEKARGKQRKRGSYRHFVKSRRPITLGKIGVRVGGVTPKKPFSFGECDKHLITGGT